MYGERTISECQSTRSLLEIIVQGICRCYHRNHLLFCENFDLLSRIIRYRFASVLPTIV